MGIAARAFIWTGNRRRYAGPDLVLGELRVRVARRGQELLLAVRVEVGEDHGRARLRRLAGEQSVDDLRGRPARAGEVLGPGAAALGPVDAGEERRDDLPELVEHHRRVLLRLRERVRAHAQQERLERLAG